MTEDVGYTDAGQSGAVWEEKEPHDGYWLELEKDLKENPSEIPPIVIEKVSEKRYEVMDGHHRISMARNLGFDNFLAFLLQ
jgi:hypothetical protein